MTNENNGPMKKTMNLSEIADNLDKMYFELDVLSDQLKDESSFAKTLENKQNKIKIKRKGKEGEIEITEGMAWEEIRILGENTEALQVMQNKYPKLFEISTAMAEKAKQIDNFTLEHFQISSTQVTMKDIIKLIKIFVAYEINKNK
jgi:hypothetical protein